MSERGASAPSTKGRKSSRNARSGARIIARGRVASTSRQAFECWPPAAGLRPRAWTLTMRDPLRQSQVPRMNEAQSNPLRAYFENNRGRMMDKWLHYFEIYHRHLARLRGQPITLLEIGVYHGGSLQMWRDYFGPQARIIGVDVRERCLEIAEPGIEILIGDQGDRQFLRKLRQQIPSIDVLIDDGGHMMHQQIASFEELYGAISERGVYLIEDLHTSYWREYGGGFRHPFSFIEYAKTLIDHLNAWHSRDGHSFGPNDFTAMTDSLHFYDSVLVIEKGPHPRPVEQRSGTPTFLSDAPEAG